MMFVRFCFLFIFFIFCGLFSGKSSVFEINNVKIELTGSIEKIPFDFLPGYELCDEHIVHAAFTLCYSEKHEQAKWVAYRLTDEMCYDNNEKRSNNFRSDTAVKTGSASPKDYLKSGYDRGHLCPAGDMGWNVLTMNQSFLMSNMSPQLPAFNRGIWKRLESNVREWAKINNEIYVVTAGVLEDSLPAIGLNNVAVPRYYYKIILDYKQPVLKAIAFVMLNKESKQSVFDFAVSIDSVEILTGIDFFPALPDSLEMFLESNINVGNWN